MDKKRTIQHRASSLKHPRTAFTLIELLVVITIIGILVALLTVAAVAALRTARQTEIKTEVNQMDTGMMEYKNRTTAFPPNCQTNFGPDEPITAAQRDRIFRDLKTHLKQAFPRHQESDTLLKLLVGQNVTGSGIKTLPGGMAAGEALVFWLSGFSSDPRYPISGEGGPSYLASMGIEDPIESRSWTFPFEVGRLGPRDGEGYFDASDGTPEPSDDRYVTYPDPRFPTDASKNRRINFWQYLPRNSPQPYLYFDTSRYTPDEIDPPARADVHVHALKRIENEGSTNERPVFIDPEKFQILHCGIDEAWGEEFDRTSFAQYAADKNDGTNLFLSFPEGPFIGDIADTIVNFTTETKLEDAQP